MHAMPAVQDILQAQPGVHIDWVVERSFVPLVARCAGIRRVIACELRTWRKKPLSSTTREQWRHFKAELKQEEYDAVIDLQGLTKSALVAWLARTQAHGVRYAMANQTDGSGYEAPTRWVADRAIVLQPHVHAVERSRIVCAQALGYTYQGVPRCGLLAGNMGQLPVASDNSLGKPYVALVHGTSRKDKEWPLEYWVELGKRLNAAGYRVALPQGSAQELAVSQAIAAQLDQAWVWPAMTLDVVTDTLAQCAAVIGVDSGLSHIAVALDVPHVQIYNFDTAWRTGPQDCPLQKSIFATPYPTLEQVWQAWLTVAPLTRQH